MTTISSVVATPADSSGDEPGWWRRLRPHLPFLTLLTLAAALRALFLLAYQPAFWFHGDSGTYLLMAAGELRPHPTRPVGYPVLLKALRPTGTLASVVVAQHLMTLGLAVAAYVLLRRRRLAGWLCCLATVPLLFDSLVLTLGHYLLPDALFTVLFVAAVLVVFWRPVPGYPAALAAGLLIVAAWVVKPVALPVALLLGLYLAVRRVEWRRLVTYGLACVVPYTAMLLWIGDRQSVYGSQSGTALYGRAAMIVDCDRITLTERERVACPDQPLGQRWDRADLFFWRRPDRLTDAYTAEGAQRLTDFAIAVIKQQPMDYLRSVAKESAAHFVPGLDLGPENECLRQRVTPPVELRGSVGVPMRCPPARAGAGYQPDAADLATAPAATPLTRALHTYGEYGRTSPVVMSIAVLLGLAILLVGSRASSRLRLDVALLLLAGPALTVFTVAIGMYEPRYALPALPLSAIAAALSWHGLRQSNNRPANEDPMPAGPDNSRLTNRPDNNPVATGTDDGPSAGESRTDATRSADTGPFGATAGGDAV